MGAAEFAERQRGSGGLAAWLFLLPTARRGTPRMLWGHWGWATQRPGASRRSGGGGHAETGWPRNCSLDGLCDFVGWRTIRSFGGGKGFSGSSRGQWGWPRPSLAAGAGGFCFRRPQSVATIEYLRTSHRIGSRLAGMSRIGNAAGRVQGLCRQMVLPSFQRAQTRPGRLIIFGGSGGNLPESASSGYVGG